jgi:hypothetical protein
MEGGLVRRNCVCAFSNLSQTRAMKSGFTPEATKGFIASVLVGALLFAITLSVSPRLHAWIHPDSDAPGHECAVTLIASGSYEHSAAPVVLTLAQPASYFATIPTCKIVWVAAPFLGASIFEHAPPALS